jgi:hypothetical protein
MNLLADASTISARNGFKPAEMPCLLERRCSAGIPLDIGDRRPVARVAGDACAPEKLAGLHHTGRRRRAAVNGEARGGAPKGSGWGRQSTKVTTGPVAISGAVAPGRAGRCQDNVPAHR